jgi:hypothetical protein
LDLYEEPKPVEKVRLQVPPEVAGIVRKPMAKRPEERYQTPGELAAVLAVLSPQKVHKEELTPTVTFVQPESVAFLRKELRSTSLLREESRIHLVTRVCLIDPPPANWLPDLLRAQRSDPSDSVRGIITLSLPRYKKVEVILPALVETAKSDTSVAVRITALKAIRHLGPKAAQAVRPVTDLLKDRDWHIREEAATTLGALGSAANGAVPQLKEALNDSNDFVRAAANRALHVIEGKNKRNRSP